MAIQDFDIIRIVTNGHVQNEAMINVWHYAAVVNGTGPSYAQVRLTFMNVVLEELASYMSLDSGFDTLLIENLTNGVDSTAFPVNIVGNAESPMATPFLAYGFRLNRLTKVTRNGYKRIGGLTEAVIDNGRIALPLEDIGIMETAINSDLETGTTPNTGTLSPVIVGRQEDGTYDLSRVNVIASVTLMPNITTQNTRKFRLSG